MDKAARVSLLGQRFQERFCGEPRIWARAPGRVDLMGSHTDYNLGFVLTLPISRDTWIAASPRTDSKVRVYSLNLDAEATFDLEDPEREGEQPWSAYIRGVAAILKSEGLRVEGFDGVLHSTVPIGSGLSSSAAMECATAVVFQELGGWKLEPERMARLCQRAENEFVGVNCGILDQYTSCLGRESCALLLDCRDLSAQPVKIASGIQVVICDTRVKRELMGSEYGVRRAQCEEGARRLGVAALRDATLEQLEEKAPELPIEVIRRSRFILEESARVPRLAEALARDDRAAIGQLCAASFSGASTLYEISSPEMHAMMRAMLGAPGVVGARQAGGGFGGCMVAFVDSGMTHDFDRAVRQAYSSATGIAPEIYAVRAAPGAGLIPPA